MHVAQAHIVVAYHNTEIFIDLNNIFTVIQIGSLPFLSHQ